MKIYSGIVSTTHIDKHRERMTKEALDDIAIQINKKFIPVLVDHNWDRCVGVNLYGDVFMLSDGEYALGTVAGVFESEEEKQEFLNEKPNNLWKIYKSYLDKENLLQLSKNTRIQKHRPAEEERSVSDLLEAHLDSTHILPDGRVYKIKKFIAGVGDLKVNVNPGDHTPAHFHIVSKQRGIDARLDLYTLELSSMKKGKIKKSDIAKIKNFFETHPCELEKLRKEHLRLCGPQ